MRILYTALFYFGLPLIVLRLYWRGFKSAAYRERWLERLGVYHFAASLHKTIWIHAVSVGEVEAVVPVVRQLQIAFPEQRFLVTTTTPTGSVRALANFGESVVHVYLPYDLPDVLARFFTHFKPLIAIFVETEIWPNIFAACAQRNVPVYIINARLSEKSVRGYQKIKQFTSSTLQHVTLVAAQTEADAERFHALGVKYEKIKVLGNIKFDSPVVDSMILEAQALKSQLFAQRFVWLIASTHKGEEAYFINLFRTLQQIAPELLLVIAPRHPERFLEVRDDCLQAGLKVISRSQQSLAPFDNTPITAEVFLLDTLGELKMFYATADLAFVAGSIQPIGGHNVLEPAAMAVPIMFGQHMHNFQAIAQGLLAVKGAVQCLTEQDIVSEFTRLYKDEQARQAMVTQASTFVAQNRGAQHKVAELLGAAIMRNQH